MKKIILVSVYNNNYDDKKKYNISICDYEVENLKISKEISMIIFGLSILLLFFATSKVNISIYNRCKDYSVNFAIRFIRTSVILGCFIVIANFYFIYEILNKIYNMYSDIVDTVDASYSIIKNIKLETLILE